MIIQRLSLRLGFQVGSYDFSPCTTIFSQQNGMGKTTLLRCVLYALGFQIPSTRGLNFSQIEFEVTVKRDDGMSLCIRRRNRIATLIDGETHSEFVLPETEINLHKIVFGVSDEFIVGNVLGAMYFDQEKGWTLLNRGKVIGAVRFSIEDLMSGLSDHPCFAERTRLKTVEAEIKKCRQMMAIADYQAEIAQNGDSVPFDSKADEFSTELWRLRNKRRVADNEYRQLKLAIKSDSQFRKYIGSMRLRVWDDNHNEVAVTESNIVGFDIHQRLLSAKCEEARVRLAEIDGRIASMESRIDGQAKLLDVETSIQSADRQLSGIRIDRASIVAREKALQAEHKKLIEFVRTEASSQTDLTNRFFSLVNGYIKELGLEDNYIRDVFTHDLKKMSGAAFHIVVFAFKISYVRLIAEKTGCFLPLIIDSPHGREVEEYKIKHMMDILHRDFQAHQLIIATIYKLESDNQLIINMTGNVMPDFDNLNREGSIA